MARPYTDSPFPNDPQPEPDTPLMTLGDIYYALFRHKWKIILCSLTGIAAAGAFLMLYRAPFQSEAKLFIRYVMESQGIGISSDDVRMKSPDQRGETIITSEVEILTSLDLAEQVASSIGPEKILGPGNNNLQLAAIYIQSHLTVVVAPKSSVLRLLFEHPNPEVVQPVLREIVDRYLKMHVEIHRAVGMTGNFLAQETDMLRLRLTHTEEELRKASNKAGVYSLEDSKKAFTEQIAKIRQELRTAEAQLAEGTAALEQVTKRPVNPTTPAETSTTTATATAPATATATEVPPEFVAEYRKILARIEPLRRREQELLTYFRDDNTRVKDIRSQITEAEAQKLKLETDYPRLIRIVTVMPSTTPSPGGGPSNITDVNVETARLMALEAKIKVLNSQLAEIRAEAATVDQMEATILELRRQKDLEETNYRNYSESLEKARINEALGTGSVQNISQVQTPSPAFIGRSKTVQIAAALAAAGIFVGFGWAFLIELYFDRTVRRAVDVERHLHLPLFISIPNTRTDRRLKLAAKEHLKLMDSARASQDKPADAPTTNGKLATIDPVQLLGVFHETLRDRLISYFESRNLTHKPKLVAVTGLGRESGVTTTAAGLARSLSETGDGNVLLVDMTAGQGSAQQFYQGKEVVGLDELLATRNNAQIQDHLFVVAEEPGTDKLSRILPHRFTKLVPKLKASDFDYIIFDMPPVSQISITPRLAGFMDMVLLVLESEKTDRNLVQRATSLLAESKSHVGVVLNKTQTYVPSQLHQESLGNT